MTARIATAIIGIPIVVYAVCAGSPIPLKILLAAVGALAVFEFSRMSGKSIWPWLLYAGYVAGLVVWSPAQSSTPWILALLAVPLLDFVTKDLPRPIVLAGWILLPLLSAVALRAASLTANPHWGIEFNQHVLLMVFLCLWAGDSMAFFVGSLIGKHKLAPSISPNKSWEGAITNVVACVIVGWLAADPLGLPGEFGAQIGAMCGLLGQLGDLYQSAWKRRHEAKDSGSLLPGHGGVLDRFDSLLFCLPAANAIAYFWRI
ncbi:MAG: phosphatidate cytidylyltransferase [Fimbriimonadales bacterium]